MQDELQELLEESGEVQALLARSYATPEDVDEGALEAELALLAAEPLATEAGAQPAYLEDAPAVGVPSARPASAPETLPN